MQCSWDAKTEVIFARALTGRVALEVLGTSHDRIGSGIGCGPCSGIGSLSGNRPPRDLPEKK